MLPQKFFERDVRIVAESLLGMYLVHSSHDGPTRSIITEVEAYDGKCDLACHASRGRTKRTEVMYGAAGHWYVYLCYGMYDMLNIVTGPKGYPAAVLIRGVQGTCGPGRLTKRLGITRALNGKRATRANGLWIAEGIAVPKKEIVRTPRIGVAYAGAWAEKLWRFVWKKSS